MSRTTEYSNRPVGAFPSCGLRKTARIVSVLLLIIVGLPLAGIAAILIYMTVIPPYSATMQIPELQTSLTLRFYYIWDEQTDQGRYLTIQTPHGRTKIAMTAFDWAHNSRTSVYRTPDGKIAILGPMGDDHLVSLDTLARKNARGPSDDWTYLGAFDFQGFRTQALNNISSVGRELRFIAADEQQPECIPMRGDDGYEWQARRSARQRNCPPPQPAAK